MARIALTPSKMRERRRRRRIVALSLAAVAVLILFGGVVWLAHASFMRITSIEVSGEQTLAAADIEQETLADISGSYWYLFPKNNIFLYPKSAVEADLKNQIPTISKVSVGARDFHTLSVVVTERARKALWCPGNPSNDVGSTTTALVSVDSGACLWLDQDGAAYAPAPDTSLAADTAAPDGYMHYYGALTGAVIPKQYLTPDQFHSLSALIDALRQNQATDTVESVAVSGNDVRATFTSQFALIFSLDSAGADVYQRFVLALGSGIFAQHPLSDFDYLDLRFGDKLYYKLKATSQ